MMFVQEFPTSARCRSPCPPFCAGANLAPTHDDRVTGLFFASPIFAREGYVSNGAISRPWQDSDVSASAARSGLAMTGRSFGRVRCSITIRLSAEEKSWFASLAQPVAGQREARRITKEPRRHAGCGGSTRAAYARLCTKGTRELGEPSCLGT